MRRWKFLLPVAHSHSHVHADTKSYTDSASNGK
jgi:hypothetical protein